MDRLLLDLLITAYANSVPFKTECVISREDWKNAYHVGSIRAAINQAIKENSMIMPAITFNLEATKQNLNDDTDLVRSVAKIVIEDLPRLVSELRAAAEVEDEPRLRQAAHTIKGMAANFGAQPLMDLARKLEAELCVASPLEKNAAVSAIGSITEKTIVALKQELGL